MNVTTTAALTATGRPGRAVGAADGETDGEAGRGERPVVPGDPVERRPAARARGDEGGAEREGEEQAEVLLLENRAGQPRVGLEHPQRARGRQQGPEALLDRPWRPRGR